MLKLMGSNCAVFVKSGVTTLSHLLGMPFTSESISGSGSTINLIFGTLSIQILILS